MSNASRSKSKPQRGEAPKGKSAKSKTGRIAGVATTPELEAEVDEVKAHFMATLGNLPDPIRAMADYAPEALVGYARTRRYIMAHPPRAALDVRTKELVYVLLDVVTGNLDGAKNHLHAAMREGLTAAQLAEACMQVMAVCGITTWGQTGWKLCDYAAQIERGEVPLGRAGKKHG
ncbi:MAG: carboxymuconolactone decarboxylase family protein [Lautropia sp.]